MTEIPEVMDALPAIRAGVDLASVYQVSAVPVGGADVTDARHRERDDDV